MQILRKLRNIFSHEERNVTFFSNGNVRSIDGDLIAKRKRRKSRDESQGSNESIVISEFRHNFRRASIFMQIGSKYLVRQADWYS